MSTTPAEAFVGYAPTAEYAEGLAGVLNVGGHDFNLETELADGDGLIVTADPATITALDQFSHALERVDIPAERIGEELAALDTAPAEVDLDAPSADAERQAAIDALVAANNRDELVDILLELDAGAGTDGTKAELADRILAARYLTTDAGDAGGDA